jgi:hypothetical protein
MIRYSSYGRSNYRTESTTLADSLRSLETEYRELQALRERVRRAEAAAATRFPRSNGDRQNSN